MILYVARLAGFLEMREAQVKRINERDSMGQAKFVASLFGVVA